MIQSFLAQMFQEKRLQHLIDDMSYNLQHLYCSWQTYYLSANILYHVHLYQLNLRRYYWHDILYNIMSCVHSYPHDRSYSKYHLNWQVCSTKNRVTFLYCDMSYKLALKPMSNG